MAAPIHTRGMQARKSAKHTCRLSHCFTEDEKPNGEQKQKEEKERKESEKEETIELEERKSCGERKKKY